MIAKPVKTPRWTGRRGQPSLNGGRDQPRRRNSLPTPRPPATARAVGQLLRHGLPAVPVSFGRGKPLSKLTVFGFNCCKFDGVRCGQGGRYRLGVPDGRALGACPPIKCGRVDFPMVPIVTKCLQVLGFYRPHDGAAAHLGDVSSLRRRYGRGDGHSLRPCPLWRRSC